MRRREMGALLIAVVLGSLFIPTVARASTGSQEADFVADINAERIRRGLGTVVVRSDLVEAARAWSQRMRSAGRIWHDPEIDEKIEGWTVLGDNVGRGPTPSAIHRAFMESPDHADVILDPRFTEVGVGVAVDGATLYVTEIFVRRTSAPAPSTVVRRARPAAAPVPAAVAAPMLALTERISGIDFRGPSMTVDVLVRLLAMDAHRVDPVSGVPR